MNEDLKNKKTNLVNILKINLCTFLKKMNYVSKVIKIIILLER